jgi:5-methylcytosine-specific restriction protein A
MAMPAPTPSRLPPIGAGTISGRSVPLWHGKTADSKVPAHVRARIFLAHDGKCWLSGRKIRPGEYWELEHRVALCNGGSHSEDNLAPALAEPHKLKTKADVREKSKVERLRKRHIGIKRSRSIRSWRKFNGDIVHANRER